MTDEQETIGIKLDATLIKDIRNRKPEWKNINTTNLTDLILREKLNQLKKGVIGV